MDYKDYIKLIGTSDIKPVCMLSGDEEYVKNSVIERLKKAYVDESMLDFDLGVFEDQSVTYDNIIPFLSAPAFISERKLAIIKLKPDNAIFKDERFATLCEEADESVLIAICISGSADKRLSLVKRLEAVSDVVSFDKLEKNDIIKWVVKTFKENGKKITPTDAQYLISLAGEELYSLQNEIGKVANSTEEDTITHDDIEGMVAHTPEHGVFLLVDAVAAKNTKDAIRQCNLLLNDGSEPFQLLALVERQLQLIMRYIGMTASGVQQKDIAQKLALKPFMYEKVRKQSQNFTLDGCKSALSMCLDLDSAIKSGKMDAKTGFELLIVRLSGGK